MPAGLNKHAKAAWRALVTDLAAEGLLNPVDAALIELCASALGRAREARALIDRDGMVVSGAKGSPIKHPALIVEYQESAEARKLLEVLGIGPSARARVHGKSGARASMLDAIDATVGSRGLRVVSASN